MAGFSLAVGGLLLCILPLSGMEAGEKGRLLETACLRGLCASSYESWGEVLRVAIEKVSDKSSRDNTRR